MSLELLNKKGSKMVERLKTVAETLWEDEKTFLEVLSILGVRKFIRTLRAPLQVEAGLAVVQPAPSYSETYHIAA